MLNRRQESQGRFYRLAKSQKGLAALREAARPVCEILEGRILLSAIPQPVIPTTVFNVVTQFNAVANGSTNDTADIQAAINAASAAGGGIVEIPVVGGTSSTYESGPLTMASNVNLEIDQGATLQALAFGTYPGSPGSGAVSPLITAHNISNFEITGFGTIDGQGAAWWTAFNANSSIARPAMIQLSNVQTVVLLNVTILNAPEQAVLFGASSGVAGNNVTINDVTITAASNSPGTDGLDIAGTNFLLEGCSITVGGGITGNNDEDSAYTSVGGDNIDISPQLVACSNIDIEDCNLGFGLGVTVGPQTTHGLNGLTVNNSVFTNTTFGIRMISGRGNGGLVENVTISDITMRTVGNALVINDYYSGNSDNTPSDPTTDPAQAVTAGTPEWENITYTELAGGSNDDVFTNLGQLVGLAEAPIQNVTFTEVTLSAAMGFETDHAHNVTLDADTQMTTFFDDDDTPFFAPQFYDNLANDTFQPFMADDSAGLDTAFDSTVTIDPMTVSNIGNPTTVGTAVYDTHYGDTVLSGTGAPFSGTSDQFVFDGTPIYGDTTLTTPFVVASGATGGSAGLMIRESLAPNAAFIFFGVVNDGNESVEGATASPTLEVAWRAQDGGTVNEETFTSAPDGSTGYFPELELLRTGNDFRIFYQVPKEGFERGPDIQVNMTEAAFMGTAVTSAGSPTPEVGDFGGPILSLPRPMMTPDEPAIISQVGLTYPATFIQPLTSTPNPVTGTTNLLSALAIQSGVEGTTVPVGFENTLAPISTGGAAIAAGATPGTANATFPALGSYTFTATAGGTDVIALEVTVIQTATTINITPAPVSPDPDVEMEAGQQLQFSATALDQFNNPMAVQPTFTFSLQAGSEGNITLTGFYTAGNIAGTATIIATANGNSGSTTVNITNEAPTVATGAAAAPNPVTAKTTSLSVLGADDGGESNLTYTWSATGPAGVTFSVNGTNGSKNTVATFSAAGAYMLTATITDQGALTTTSEVNVTVKQTPTQISVVPSNIILVASAAKQFAISAIDQFGNPILSAPTAVWSLLPGSIGAITTGGRYVAPGSSGSATVIATLGLLTAEGTILVNTGPPTVVTAAASTPPIVTGHTAALSVLGSDGAGESTLTYVWSSAGPSPVSFSANDSNGAKSTVATFNKAGMYEFICVMTDQSGLTATTSVHVSVQQVVTAITVGPSSVTLSGNGHQAFTATATDQFGNAMTTRPAFVWTLGDGSIGILNAAGHYTAPNAAGSATVIASVGSVSSSPVDVTVDVPTDSGTPTFSQAAQASTSSTTAASVTLSAIGVDPLAGTIIYRWVASGPGPVTLIGNNRSTAGNITATFHKTGTYNFTVLIRGSSGEFAATGVSVTIVTEVASIRMVPVAARLLVNKTHQFRAIARDQFNHVIVGQTFTWSLTGGSVGSVGTSTGLFSAGVTPGSAGVEAAAGLLDATAAVTVLA